jgi:cytochrome c oxidase subunit 2
MSGQAFRWLARPAAMADFPAPIIDAPLNYFLHSHGPASRPVMILGWVFAAVCVVVCIIIAVMLVAAITRKRKPAGFSTIGREEEGQEWIYIGTGISACILFALAVYAMITLNAIAKPAKAPGLVLSVTGYDWWWKVAYEDADLGRRFVTANEIHIPVGAPVLIKLDSADVIHAFWTPKLAGKTQMIPGLTNQQWLQADEAGVYRGQCTQYCGVQHAHMALEVIAQEPDFMAHCSGCHAVRGTKAAGDHGPDLTHLNSRRLLAAGMFVNTPEQLIKWVTHAQELKPGSRMPSIALSSSEAADLSAFLATLN